MLIKYMKGFFVLYMIARKFLYFIALKQHEKNICIAPSIIQIRHQWNQRNRYPPSRHLPWMVEQPSQW